jgi:SMODS domain-containing protein
MALTVAQAFNEFADKLKPTASQEATIADRRANVEKFLRDAYGPTSNMPLQHVKVIGSAARKTLIRPVDDLDVFAVFDDSQVWSQYQSNSQQLLYRVREAFTGYTVQTVGSRGQAVRLFYTGGPNVDITPAFPLYDFFRVHQAYVIPRGDGTWQTTDPYQHTDFMASRNTALGGYLKPLVRLLKRWNRVHSSRLRSFHLEMVVQATFSGLGSNMRENVHDFFIHADRFLHVHDPAGHSGDLGARLTYNQEQAIKQSFTTADGQVQRARNAEVAYDVPEALRQWRLVFGNEFPSYG